MNGMGANEIGASRTGWWRVVGPLMAVMLLSRGAAGLPGMATSDVEGAGSAWATSMSPPPAAPEGEPQVPGLDWDALADELVERMSLEPGERVLLIGLPGGFDPLVPRLRAEVSATGAQELGALSVEGEAPESWQTAFVGDARNLSRSELAEHLAGVDLAFMLPGANVNHAAYAAMQDVLRSGRGRTIHFHWAGAYDLRGRELPVTEEVSELYERALLETDYAALATAQRRFEEAMRGSVIRVTTPLGTDIRFEIGDRAVTRQDGDASARRAARARNLIDREIELPAGAVRVAPVEETVAGTIAFPPSVWGDEAVEGLVMSVERGRLTGFEAATGRAAVERELEAAGESGRAFREFALGMNPLLAIPEEGEPWIPYYGYGAGVVRLSLGDNTELGGDVGGGWVRWNFFHDATVVVGDEVWVRDGDLRADLRGAIP